MVINNPPLGATYHMLLYWGNKYLTATAGKNEAVG